MHGYKKPKNEWKKKNHHGKLNRYDEFGDDWNDSNGRRHSNQKRNWNGRDNDFRDNESFDEEREFDE